MQQNAGYTKSKATFAGWRVINGQPANFAHEATRSGRALVVLVPSAAVVVSLIRAL